MDMKNVLVIALFIVIAGLVSGFSRACTADMLNDTPVTVYYYPQGGD
jgi:hypothetical protein